MQEKEILRLFTLKDNLKFNKYILRELLTAEARSVLETTLEYTGKYLKDIDSSGTLKFLLEEKFKSWSAERKGVLFGIADEVFKTPLPPNAGDVIKSWLERDFAEQASQILQRIAVGDKTADISEFKAIQMAYETTSRTAALSGVGEEYVTQDLDQLLDRIYRSSGYHWGLEDLNRMVGPLHKGDFVVVGARPEAGKTSFILSEAANFIGQDPDKRPVLIINNEEAGDKLGLRFQQATTQKTLTEMDKDRLKAKKAHEIVLNGSKGLLVRDDNNCTTGDIERIVEQEKPFLVVFNVLDKVRGFSKSSFNETDRLKQLAQWVRDLAKNRDCICIAVVQADASAEGEKWVRQSQLYMSKTGLPGEADVIVTIGATHDPADIGTRFIHIPKNKLPGGPRTIEAEKHGYAEVKFEADRCKFVSLRWK